MTKTVAGFKAAHGSRLTDEQAEVYGQHLTSMMEDGKLLTPDEILLDAEKKRSPLHDFFEWDDEQAAHKYRLTQARDMLRWIKVVVISENGDTHEEEIRAFVNVKVTVVDKETDKIHVEQGYTTLAQAITKPDQLDYLKKEALRKLDYFSSMYRMLEDTELKGVFEAIREVKKRLAGK